MLHMIRYYASRKDLIDEAILRPGRLEMHIEIGLPDEAGRIQVIRVMEFFNCVMRRDRFSIFILIKCEKIIA